MSAETKTLWAIVSHRGPERFFLSSREAYEFLSRLHDDAPTVQCPDCGEFVPTDDEPYEPRSLTVEPYEARRIA